MCTYPVITSRWSVTLLSIANKVCLNVHTTRKLWEVCGAVMAAEHHANSSEQQ